MQAEGQSGETSGGVPSPPTKPTNIPFQGDSAYPSNAAYPDVAPPQGLMRGSSIDFKVSKRLLWVGEAAYPLQNITRVYTLTLHPRRKEATALFLKRLLITAVVVVGLLLVVALPAALASGEDSGPGWTVFIVLGGVAAVIYSIVELLAVLGAPPCFVLSVETNGPSTAVVTSENPDQLRQLVHQLVYAIEHPDAEFAVKVESLTVSPKHYYFGDNVNMYGGNGNVGMTSA